MAAIKQYARLRGRAPIIWIIALALARTHFTECQKPITSWERVYSTFYGGIPDDMDPNEPSYGTAIGSCGYGLLNKTDWPYWTVGALSTTSHFYIDGPIQGCGMCFEVQCMERGPIGYKPGSCQRDPMKRSIIMMVTSSCPECPSNHIDLQALTWAKIANPSPTGGRINARMRRVECVPPSNLHVEVDSNRGDKAWMRFTVQKVGGPSQLSQVQVSGANSTEFVNLDNKWGAAWETGQSPMSPIDVRMVANDSSQVTQPDAITFDKQIGDIKTSVQFDITDNAVVQPSGRVLPPSRVSPLPPEDDSMMPGSAALLRTQAGWGLLGVLAALTLFKAMYRHF